MAGSDPNNEANLAGSLPGVPQTAVASPDISKQLSPEELNALVAATFGRAPASDHDIMKALHKARTQNEDFSPIVVGPNSKPSNWQRLLGAPQAPPAQEPTLEELLQMTNGSELKKKK